MADKPIETPPAEPAPPRAAKTPTLPLACTVLVSGTVIGPLSYGRNAKVHLPPAAAQTLAALTPPRVRIDGI